LVIQTRPGDPRCAGVSLPRFPISPFPRERRTRRNPIVRVTLAVVFALSVASLERAPALPTASGAQPEPLTHAGRWLTDATGRVVLVRGVNMVSKLPPYTPAFAGFSDDDAALIAQE